MYITFNQFNLLIIFPDKNDSGKILRKIKDYEITFQVKSSRKVLFLFPD